MRLQQLLQEDTSSITTILTYFQIQYNIIVRTSRRTYPRYFKLEFAFNRAKYKAQPRHIDPAKVELQRKVVELRSYGLSLLAIAKRLNISVGSVWNMTRVNTSGHRDNPDNME